MLFLKEFSYLHEIRARGLLNLGENILIIKIGKIWCSLKELDCHFKWIKSIYEISSVKHLLL